MAIVQIYASRGPEGDRFVRINADGIGYSWCIRSLTDRRYDVAQGRCDAEDIPDDIREQADLLRDHAFGYVPWPRP